MAKVSSRGLLAVALLLSFATAALVYHLLSSSLQKQAPSVGEAVVTAKLDIPAKTRITAEMIQESKMPAEYIQAGAMRELGKVVGLMTREAIVAGEQVLSPRLLLEGKQVGLPGVIPAGKRALTVAVTDVTGVSGLLKAGDYVDVIVTFDQQVVGDHVSQMFLQNLLVLAVNRDSELPRDAQKKDAAAPVKLATVTLAVSPAEAAKVTLAEEKGKLRVALRPYVPESGPADARPVTPTDMVGVHKSPLQAGKTEGPPEPGGKAPAAAAGRPDKNSTGITVIRGTKVE